MSGGGSSITHHLSTSLTLPVNVKPYPSCTGRKNPHKSKRPSTMSFKPKFTTSHQDWRAKRGQQNRSQRRAIKVSKARSVVPRTMGPFAQTESKYFDSFVSAAAVAESVDWTGTEIDPAANSIFTPTEGADIDNRIGRKASMYKLAIRGVIVPGTLADQADILPSPVCRIILFMDMQTNGGQAQGETVMAAPGAATAALTFCTFQNTANFGRFRVLRDKTFKLGIITSGTDGVSTTSQGSQVIPFKLTVKFPTPVEVRFNATNGGTIGDVVDNSFHMLAQKSGGDFTHTISYQARCYYKDK